MSTRSSQKIFTGPFLIREDIFYHQDTNELVTGAFESFHENGQLQTKGTFIDGKQDGLCELFDENEILIKTETWENGELVE